MTARAVPIDLDKPRTVRFPMASLERLHAEHGINVFAIGEDAFTDPATLSAIAWAGLIHEDPDLTIDAVKQMCDLQDIKTMLRVVTDAMGGDELDPTAPPSG